MEKLEFRTLREDEIDCRVGRCNDKGCSLLMYKDARVDMRLLDDVVGPMNWKRSHELINGNLFCTVSIRNEQGEWVPKEDVGTESDTEKEKGQASDAFKRACFNWGIGRELYSCPFVWINLAADEWRTGFNGKKQPKTKFYVSNIEYDEKRNVSYLRIVDGKGVERYVYGKSMCAEADKKELIARIKGAKDRHELEAIYKSAYPALKKDKAVLDACTDKAVEFQDAT